ncbi:MAG: transcriptional regulator BetI [Rhizobiales bacterium]|nr:transcriptional regulator BetI [Hyphomicrobiales bacterium]
MPKLGMAPVRRKQLIDAAIAAIHDYGFADATVARIAAKAGVSTGIVHHYFADKNDLLAATMRALLEILRREAVERLKLARDPRARVDAVIHASFGDAQFGEEVFSAWLALYGNARTSDRLQRILRIYHRRLDSNLRHGLTALVGKNSARSVALNIAALIDGLWLRYALTGRPDNPETPRALTRDYLDAKLVALNSVALNAEPVHREAALLRS